MKFDNFRQLWETHKESFFFEIIKYFFATDYAWEIRDYEI